MNSPFFSIGFRPFFFFAAVASATLMTIWQLTLAGKLSLELTWNPVHWHAHEMIFGFVSAVLAGFILTASQNWSGKKGVHGTRLFILLAVWIGARLLSTSTGVLFYLHSILDLLFFPILMYYLLPYLALKTQKRNWVFFVYFSILFVADIFIHLEQLGLAVFSASAMLKLSVHIVLIIMVLIAGRVLPFFTSKVLPGSSVNVNKHIESLSMYSLYAFTLASVLPVSQLTMTFLSAVVFIVHLIRFSGWSFLKSFKVPILSVLYISYLWILLYFLLSTLQPYIELPASTLLHVLTVGGIGLLIYGMVTRVSLGHSGRKIIASKQVIFAYILINLAALCRSVLLFVLPESTELLYFLSSFCWVFAFLIFIFNFSKILFTPRMN